MNPEYSHGSYDLPYKRPENTPSPEIARHNRIVCYTGVSSSGKDFLLDYTMNQMQESHEFQAVSMGTLMANNLQMHRDSLRVVPELDDIRKAQMAAIPEVLSRMPVVVNTHIIFKYKDLLVFNPEVERQLSPAHYVVVTSEPQTIQRWRIQRDIDGVRLSDVEEASRISFHQNMVVNTARSLANETGAKLTVLYNVPEQTQTNSEMLRDIFLNL